MKKLAKVVTAAILFFMSAYPVETQERRAPVVAAKAGRVLDVRTGRYLEHQLIWIENGRVMQVGAETELASRVPKDARIVDLSRYTVLPGLIDAHTHVYTTNATELDRWVRVLDEVGAAKCIVLAGSTGAKFDEHIALYRRHAARFDRRKRNNTFRCGTSPASCRSNSRSERQSTPQRMTMRAS